jgi:hypothetical protein
MTTPESPLEKKESSDERPLTADERISRLEIALENAYNVLARENHRIQMKVEEDNGILQGDLTRTLTLMNMSTLQNIVSIRVLAQELVAKGLLDQKDIEAKVAAELNTAVEAQQKVMQEARDAAQKAATEPTAVAQ